MPPGRGEVGPALIHFIHREALPFPLVDVDQPRVGPDGEGAEIRDDTGGSHGPGQGARVDGAGGKLLPDPLSRGLRLGDAGVVQGDVVPPPEALAPVPLVSPCLTRTIVVISGLDTMEWHFFGKIPPRGGVEPEVFFCAVFDLDVWAFSYYAYECPATSASTAAICWDGFSPPVANGPFGARSSSGT